MINVAVVHGRLVADPELRNTPNGVAVTSFTLAVNRSYVRQGAERQTDFVDVVAWRGTAEFVCRYFKKGQAMAIQGSIQTRTYTDSQGNKRKAVEIVADNVHFVESKNSGQSGSDTGIPFPTDEDSFAPSFSTGSTEDFAEIESDDDLPF